MNEIPNQLGALSHTHHWVFLSSWFQSQVCRALGMPRAEHGGAMPPSLLWLEPPWPALDSTVFCISFWVRAPAARFNRLLLENS